MGNILRFEIIQYHFEEYYVHPIEIYTKAKCYFVNCIQIIFLKLHLYINHKCRHTIKRKL